jgi:hypothetical protein
MIILRLPTWSSYVKYKVKEPCVMLLLQPSNSIDYKFSRVQSITVLSDSVYK